MDCFIKKIFDNKGKDAGDKLIHLQFQKFSRGEFKDKAVVSARKSADKFSINTTSEYANEFVRIAAEKLGNNKTHVTGGIITTFDLTGKLDFVDKKQFMGVKQYVLDKDMSGTEILSICDNFAFAFIALSFNAPSIELKIKAKAPKSAKPSTKSEDKPKSDFCKLITTDKNVAKSILFDIPESFKKVDINHVFSITDIILPQGEKDFAKMREMAKRKGKIIRTINIDEKIEKKEVDFIA